MRRASNPWYPEPKDVLGLHFELVALFANGDDPISPAGQRDLGLLESACGRPRTSLAGVEKYTSVEEKAAALFHSLVKNHPFHNGNKRTALATLVTFLWRNDRRLAVTVSDDEVFDMVLNVARDAFAMNSTPDGVVSEVASWLKDRTVSLRRKPAPMRVEDFLANCRRAGLTWKLSGPSYVVFNKDHNRSIRISRSTGRLDPPVVREYMVKLGLRDVTVAEFQAGLGDEQSEMMRFRQLFRRLAHV